MRSGFNFAILYHQFQLGGWPPTTIGTIVLCLSKYYHRIKNFPSNGPNNKNRHRCWCVGSWRDGKCTIGIWTYQKTNSKEGSTQWGLDLFPGKRHENWFMVRWPQTYRLGQVWLECDNITHMPWISQWLIGSKFGRLVVKPSQLRSVCWSELTQAILCYWHIEHRVNVEMISTTWVIYSSAV